MILLDFLFKVISNCQFQLKNGFEETISTDIQF